MADDPIKDGARLIALEYMICHVYNIVLRSTRLPEDAISESERRGLDLIGLTTFAGTDPAMSDHMSAEIRDALADLMRSAREMREAAARISSTRF